MTQTNNKPSFEVADILREYIQSYQEAAFSASTRALQDRHNC